MDTCPECDSELIPLADKKKFCFKCMATWEEPPKDFEPYEIDKYGRVID